jgi:exosome complex exonuclease DIS3/RRP44
MPRKRTKSNISNGSPQAKTPTFADEMRSFLRDPDNAALLRDTVVGALMQEMSELRKSLQQKDAEIESVQGTVQTLKNEMKDLHDLNDELEQYSRRNSIRIIGLREERPSDDAVKTILQLCNQKLSLVPPLTASDIDRAHRVGTFSPTATKPRPLLVKFATYQQRYRVITRKKHLSSDDVFLYEDLTRKRSAILFSTRQAKKENKISDCWSSDRHLFVKTIGGRKVRIRTSDDICIQNFQKV